MYLTTTTIAVCSYVCAQYYTGVHVHVLLILLTTYTILYTLYLAIPILLCVVQSTEYYRVCVYVCTDTRHTYVCMYVAVHTSRWLL